ncbi:S-adenosyl-L-methionine-dependent methyltransferase [Dendrothele bispora CBS 962.96]|uniref:S-adenosyl-L-methionine-dependent methyltransferase n=1 Tax=Dendrothele bispora (strain CBS 962.96) TaxID=1314807 RepID=A0A4S8KVY2_DENBC|nr:S-adenosyl-L-methionine-dependent methyltransferase [Dendrothele bispora CBS 962.96]
MNNCSAELNKTYFNSDNTAEKYDDHPLHAEMAKRIGHAIVDAYPFDDETTTILDYACGTGLNSRQLAPHAKLIVGVDISQGMVDTYNQKISNQGIPFDEMRAVCLELKGEEGELDGMKFDVVQCCMSYHHFSSESLLPITSMLAFFLKEGGCLFVADVQSTPEREDIFGDGLCSSSVVTQKTGFSEEEMFELFTQAGLGSFRFERITRARKNGRSVNIFLAQGLKSLAGVGPSKSVHLE